MLKENISQERRKTQKPYQSTSIPHEVTNPGRTRFVPLERSLKHSLKPELLLRQTTTQQQICIKR